MFKGAFFVLRIAIAWTLLFIALLIILLNAIDATDDSGPFVLAAFILGALVIAGAVSHVRRVRLIAGRVDEGTLRSRQRRQIEIPFEAGEAFDMIDAAVRELPRSQEIESARDRVQARKPADRWSPDQLMRAPEIFKAANASLIRRQWYSSRDSLTSLMSAFSKGNLEEFCLTSVSPKERIRRDPVIL